MVNVVCSKILFLNFLYTFRQKTDNDTEFLTIQKASNTCGTTVGRNRGREASMKLDPDICNNTFQEFFHVLGLLHEHQRSDRDEYVAVQLQNIPYNYDKEFRKLRRSFNLDLPYDGTSIQHFKTFELSVMNEQTITSKVSKIASC